LAGVWTGAAAVRPAAGFNDSNSCRSPSQSTSRTGSTSTLERRTCKPQLIVLSPWEPPSRGKRTSHASSAIATLSSEIPKGTSSASGDRRAQSLDPPRQSQRAEYVSALDADRSRRTKCPSPQVGSIRWEKSHGWVIGNTHSLYISPMCRSGRAITRTRSVAPGRTDLRTERHFGCR
jgi:hypothetical protein